MTSFSYRAHGASFGLLITALVMALTSACSSSDNANGTGPVGTAGTPGAGGAAPIIPQLTETCPDFVDGTITFMGLPGIQIVTGPKPPGPTAPMVFYWHGTGSVSSEFTIMAPQVRDGVVAEGGVLVSFQGTTGGDLLSGLSVFGAGDFNLTDQLVACAVRDHNIDPRRIFTTGCSAGGLFAAAMSAMRSSYIAAVATNSGGFLGSGPAFEDDHTPALMTIHGARGQDKVFIEFTDSSKSADDVFKGRGGFVVACDTGAGHCGGAGEAPGIWELFKAHPYGVQPEPWSGGLPADFPSICQIY
jgi:predicted esterase